MSLSYLHLTQSSTCEKIRNKAERLEEVKMILPYKGRKQSNMQKTEHAEKMKNKIAMFHKEVEEKRAMVEAKHVEDIFKAEEKAAKYCKIGDSPKKLPRLF